MSTTFTTPLQRILVTEGRRQSWLAHRLGVGETQVSKWVTGKVPVPHAHRPKIAQLLGREQHELFIEDVQAA